MQRFRHVLLLACLSLAALPGGASSSSHTTPDLEPCWEQLKDDLRDCLNNFCVRDPEGMYECNPAFDPCADAAVEAYRYCRLGR